jgi:hypothetical protein
MNLFTLEARSAGGERVRFARGFEYGSRTTVFERPGDLHRARAATVSRRMKAHVRSAVAVDVSQKKRGRGDRWRELVRRRGETRQGIRELEDWSYEDVAP